MWYQSEGGCGDPTATFDEGPAGLQDKRSANWADEHEPRAVRRKFEADVEWDASEWSHKGGGDDAGMVTSRPLLLKYSGKEDTPSDNLYITGLPNVADQDTLNDLFTGIGLTIIRSRIIPDAMGTGYSAGMVQLASQAEAATAIGALKGKVVSFPGPPSDSVQTSFAGYNGGGKGWKGSHVGGWQASGGGWQASGVGWQSSDGGWQARVAKGWKGGGGVCAKGGFGGKGGFCAKGGAGYKGGAVANSSGPSNASVLKVVFAGREHTPSDNLYLTGLPSSVSEALLNEMFKSLNFTVKRSRIIADTMGYGTCAAMVQVGSTEEAVEAISKLDGESIMLAGGSGGAATPVEPMQVKGKGKSTPYVKPLMVKYAGKDGQPSENLYMTGLPSNVDETAMRQLFEQAGFNVSRTSVIPDAWGTGYSAALASVSSVEEAAAAIEALNGQVVEFANVSGPPPASADRPAFAGGAKGHWWGGKGGDEGSWDGKGRAKGKDADFVKTLMLKYAGRDNMPSENLYMTGVPAGVDVSQLTQMFVDGGFTVVRARVIPDAWGNGYCAGMVQLGGVEEATQAIQAFTGHVLQIADGGSDPFQWGDS